MSNDRAPQEKTGQPTGGQHLGDDDGKKSHIENCSPDSKTQDPNKSRTANDSQERNSRHARKKPNDQSSRTKDKSSDNQRRKYMNSENRTTLDTVGQLQRKLKRLKKDRLGTGSDFAYDACAKCLEDNILPEWKLTVMDIRDSETFLRLSLQTPLDEEVMEICSNEYVDLLGIAQRSQDFEILIPEVRRKLLARLQCHVYRYCVTLMEEVGGMEVASAKEYQRHVDSYIHQLDEKNKEAEEEYKTYRSLTRPFLEYVRGGSQHAACMGRLCDVLLAACQVVENWVKEDDAYPDKLTQDIEKNLTKLDAMRTTIFQHQEKIQENKEEILRTWYGETRAVRAYAACKKDKETLKTRHAQLLERRELYQWRLESKQKALEELKEERKEKCHLTPRESYDFMERFETLERVIGKYEKERKITEKQIKRVEKEIKPTSDRTYEEKVDYVEKRNHREELEKDNNKRRQNIQDIRMVMEAMKRQNENIRTIRELKLSQESFRKKQREKRMQKIHEENGSHTLSQACQYAAPSIGKDWRKLYLRLPFDPPRPKDRRQHDVNTIDYICARHDVTVEEQALKSLNKWRSFHRRGNVNELIQSLMHMKKKSVARDIETKFAVTAA